MAATTFHTVAVQFLTFVYNNKYYLRNLMVIKYIYELYLHLINN